MAASNLLATSTPNLKNLLGNGRTYRVPTFQRDYSWKEEHWEDLWLDLLELTSGRSGQHYMGSLVLMQEDHPEKFTIIDGQQRIATLSILILAVIGRLKELAASGSESEPNMERAAVLRNSFIGAKQAGSLLETSKLTLNRNDDDFYQGTLVQLEKPASERSLGDSERQLWGAFRYFSKRISDELRNYTGQQLAEWVESLVSVHLLFIQVVVENDVGAYTVFETLNARGLELTASDLIKNYLMSLVSRKGQGDLEHVLRRWQRITAQIGARRLPEFLRHFFNSKFPFVRQERLFRRIREEVSSAEDAIDLIRDLERAAACYQALQDPESEFWMDFPGAAEQVRSLVLFNVSQYKPLALAACRHLPVEAAVMVLRDCATLSFRFNVISRLGTHELENRYNEAALGITSGSVINASNVRELLMPVYVDDDQFVADFEVFRQATSSKGKKVIRYILCELEKQHSGQDLSWNNTNATIEHILPDSFDVNWEGSFTEEEHARYVDRLGNYALLEKGKNKDLGQKSFEEKSAVFRTSQYGLTQKLADYEEWTPSLLGARQRALARIAKTVWRFPG
ncbi:DUF262 domain-containing protein [Luteolibacter sp. Populi]|uniref:DUF262 domain-containing protein n=1 Tax=Luteolibacter sp. Populi TaxID=3230487 RepID=UPI003465E767